MPELIRPDGQWPGDGRYAGTPLEPLLRTARPLLFADNELQRQRDYRITLRDWFGQLPEGGRLVIVVPHAHLHERGLALPSRRDPSARRLYTPASLLDEVEEALVPNSYRLRWLGDLDTGYDYASSAASAPRGLHHVAIILDRIAPPAWSAQDDINKAVAEGTPAYHFEPERTREERLVALGASRILVLKLDHLGDFILGLPALHALRRAFPSAQVTLVAGSWNEEMARREAPVDEIIAFDAFPRNSSEEEVDVRGQRALFARAVPGDYDLAIDLRTDEDTRFLLRDVRARCRAGIGTHQRFPFLDIFLPVDGTRGNAEVAWSEHLRAGAFRAHPRLRATEYAVVSARRLRWSVSGPLVWGPYRTLAAGNYLFEPAIDSARTRAVPLRWDVSLDARPVASGMLDGPLSIRFDNDADGAAFEFRLWRPAAIVLPAFSFYGGRLAKSGGGGVLHQSEYLRLLVELVRLRLVETGSLEEDAA